MKKIFILYLLSSIAFLQAQQTSNRFAESEQKELSVSSTLDGTPNEPPNTKCPDGTEDCEEDQLPAPIDDYIHLLFIVAMCLIVFKQKQLQHRKNCIKRF